MAEILSSARARDGLAGSDVPSRATGTRLLERVALCLDLWSERRTLAQLDRRMLADIGIEQGAAMREAARAPWDIPAAREAGGRYGLDC